MSVTTTNIIMNSWRGSTQKQYEPALKKWLSFCENSIDPFNPKIDQALDFLSQLYNEGASFHSMSNARSALSTFIKPFDSTTFGRLPIVKRYMKGVFESRPTFPKSCITWDVNILFNYFRSLPDIENLSLKLLSLKLASLIAIASGGQRVQTLQSLDINNINYLPDKVIIPITTKIKQTKPSKHIEPLELKGFPQEPKLCPVLHLKHYMTKVDEIRASDSLFVSYIKPHKAVSKDTISRWCKQMIANSGININLYTAHSNRSATTSKCNASNIPLTEIMKKAGWSNARTFAKHYNKIIIDDVNLMQILTT